MPERADAPTMNRTGRVILAASVVLTVVAFSGAAAEAAPSTETTTSTTITVKDGDSLAGLAWRNGVRLSALLRANSITLTTVIHPGDTLIIPPGTAAGTSPTPARTTSSATTTPAAAPATSSNADTTYVVRAGDALAGIAWRNGVKLGALVSANDISTTSVILPGQSLRIPPATMPVPVRRTVTTTSTAPVAPNPVAPNPAPPAATGGSLQTLLGYLTAQVGVPYRFFSAGPDTFDCSGLVVAGFKQIGMTLPHQSRSLARVGAAVDWTTEAIAPGDLVFTSATNDPASITHVGVAIDSRRWVQAVGFGRTVSIGAIPNAEKIMAVRRIQMP